MLASSSFGPALAALELERVLLIPTAANALADRATIVEAARSELFDHGAEVLELDLDDPAAVSDLVSSTTSRPDAVCCSGGDPYLLLAACRRSGFDELVRSWLEDGVAWIGQSAGALVAGPTLAPIADVTPFERPPGLDVTALGVSELLALPHDDRPGRRAAHAAAQRSYGGTCRMVAIRDGESLSVDGSSWTLSDHAAERMMRPARIDDAAGVAECLAAAGAAAWTFLGDQVAAMEPQVGPWTTRIGALEDPDDLLVAIDDDGVHGFVHVRSGVDEGVGEVDTLFSLPRVWGAGVGRRLLTLGLDRLRARGCDVAVLWTEERNDRARRIYERAGWVLDGACRDRVFVDVPIHELRYRLPL